jgi:hypothetical protein
MKVLEKGVAYELPNTQNVFDKGQVIRFAAFSEQGGLISDGATVGEVITAVVDKLLHEGKSDEEVTQIVAAYTQLALPFVETGTPPTEMEEPTPSEGTPTEETPSEEPPTE